MKGAELIRYIVMLCYAALVSIYLPGVRPLQPPSWLLEKDVYEHMKLTSTCCQGWEDEANHPAEDIHESYEVVFAPMVFVRKAGTAVQILLQDLSHLMQNSQLTKHTSPQFRFFLTFLRSLPLCCFYLLVSSPGPKYRH